MAATAHLQKQLRDLQKDCPAGFRVESEKNIFEWTVWFAGPPDTPYFGGVYKATLNFPQSFPMEPPVFRIVSSFWHPNVYGNEDPGKVCISILHAPGVDELNDQETAMMRWTPVQSIRSVLLSVVSLLSDPDPKDAGAPANVNALVQYRSDRPAYEAKCMELAEKALRELPADFVPLKNEETVPFVPVLRNQYTYDYDFSDDEEDEEDESRDLFEGVQGGKRPPKEIYADELRQLHNLGLDPKYTDDILAQMIADARGDMEQVLSKVLA
ncbi:ubiquitin-conjugating enzyme protein [Strigomonas culicis]|uniref:Ubiquitin-conjugating enzyme protein n=1 Tax=Strigomonas culicis TaxID=28005 RepID=S9VUF9_9TRYP|nr:ubiquitin-conjugating enzyme protein [Strigomonas culicis]|eukprot:EPY30796.1 ubiquitin-conjugating enzyme protein [Strigomonas culicis]